MTSEHFSVARHARALRTIATLTIISISFGLGWPHASAAALNDKHRPEPKLLSVPLSFEPNQGQSASTVQFLSRGAGYALYLTPGNLVLNLERQQSASAAAAGHAPQAASVDTLRMSLIGANLKANPVGLLPQPGVVSYFIGNDPKKWRTGIPTYGRVNYAQIYPGVDLVFYGNQRQLEYDFVVAPGADPSRIAWRIEGASASVDARGNLTLNAPHGPATFRKPVVYQMFGDKKANVEGAFVVAGDQVGFRLGSYDRSQLLVIDPVLSYVTYLAGSSADYIGQYTAPLVNSTSQGLAIDAAGSVYVTGRTTSADFPTKNPYQGASNKGSNSSVFVAKFSPDGSSLVYSTILSGIGVDYADAIAVDSSGNAYVTGNTNSNDFPVTSGAYQTLCSPSPSNPPGTVTKASCYTNNSAFVTKLNPAGTGLVYSTFLGGYGGSEGTAIAVDSAGRAYVAGNENAPCNLSYTFPACFPTTAGATIATSAAQNGQWAFAAVFDPTGANLLYSTLFGDLNGLKSSLTISFGTVLATGMTVDSSGYFYVIGDTKAGKLPTTPGAFQPTSGPLDYSGSNVTAYRGFVAKYSPVTSAPGPSLAACTYLGGKTGNTSDYLNGIAIDSSGNIYVVGYTNSSDFPVTSGAFSTACGQGGTCDAGHLTKLNSSLSSIVWSTYLGGSQQDGGDNMTFVGPVQLDGKGNVYVTGIANNRFPLVNPLEPAGSGGAPGQVVLELDPTGSNLLFSTNIGSGWLDSMTAAGLAVNSAGVIYVAGNNIGADLITTPGAFETADPSPVPTCCYHGFVAKISPTVVEDAAGYQPAISPGAWVVIFDTNPSLKARTWNPDTEIINGKFPTQLDGVSVTIDGKSAAMYYISPGQLNVQAPDDTATGPVQVVVTTPQGTAATTATMQTVSPGLFMYPVASRYYAIAQHLTQPYLVGPSNPAQPGETLVLWATGFGPTSPPTPSGQVVTTAFPVVNLSAITLTIGGKPAQVLWAGITIAGEWQLNIQVPQGLPSGDAAIVGQIDGMSTQGNVFLSIQAP
jgi:uncharacterized protein (TIGR03437 family)